MRPSMQNSIKSIITCISVFIFCSTPAFCRDDALPKAEDVLDRFIEVTGGVEAYARIQNRRERIEFRDSFEPGPAITLFEYQKPGSKIAQTKFAGGDVYRWGNHAGVAWEIFGSGPSILTGDDEKWSSFYTTVDLEHDWRKLYTKTEVLSRTAIDDVACYKVALTTKSGLPMTKYFEIRTGLMRGFEFKRKAPEGTRHTLRVFSDYRRVDGLLIPHEMNSTNRLVETGAGWTGRGKVLSIEHNVIFELGHFEPPEQIKVLVKKAQGVEKE